MDALNISLLRFAPLINGLTITDLVLREAS